MTNRYLILTAQVISLVLSPFYLPVVAFIMLLFFSYLSYTSWQYNLQIIGMVYLFTVLLPRLAIYAYRKINGWTRHELGKRERRIVPYILSISSYTALLYMMNHMRMPRFTMGIVAGALAIQIVCALVNPWLKVSTHAAASGGVIGAIMAFSLIFNFDPTYPLCLGVFVAGLVCTARMILRQHTLTDLGVGLLIGLFCALFFILKI